MKRWVPVLGLMLLAALVLQPAPVKGEMYAEVYLGGVSAASSGNPFKADFPDGSFTPSIKGNFDNPFFTGGLKLGTWFVKEGFLGYDYPPLGQALRLLPGFQLSQAELPQPARKVYRHGARTATDTGWSSPPATGDL